jgi:hypothetical protein
MNIFLNLHKHLRLITLLLFWVISIKHSAQTTPGPGYSDSFFYNIPHTNVNGNCTNCCYINCNWSNYTYHEYARIICEGDSFIFLGKTYHSVFPDTTISDSIRDRKDGGYSYWSLTYKVFPHRSSSYSVTKLICAGETYLWNGVLLGKSGAYEDTFTSIYGCDSIAVLNLVVSPKIMSSFTKTICSGETYLWNGIQRGKSGTYLDTFTSSNGCDSIVTLNLIVNQVTKSSIFDTICPGDSFLFNGLSLTSAGIYKDTLINSSGCDSILTLYLSIYQLPSLNIHGKSVICGNETINLNVDNYFDKYHWSTGGKSSAIAVSEEDIYEIEVIDSNSCSQSATHKVIKQEQMIFGYDTFGCEGTSILLKGPSNFQNSFLWSNRNTSQSISVNQSGQYKLIVTTSLGCRFEGNYTARIVPLPLPKITNEKTHYCKTEQVDLKADISGGIWSGEKVSNGKLILTDDDKVYNTIVSYSVEDSGCVGHTSKKFTYQEFNQADIFFEASTSNFVKDSVLLIDISYPKPDSIKWVFESNATVISENTLTALITSSNPFTNVKMYAHYGICEIPVTKKIIFNRSTNINDSIMKIQLAGFVKTDLYPNPVSTGNLSIDVVLNKIYEKLSLKIYDMQARQMYSEEIDNISSHKFSINPSIFNKGKYIAIVRIAGHTKTLQFIVDNE